MNRKNGYTGLSTKANYFNHNEAKENLWKSSNANQDYFRDECPIAN